MSRSKSFDLKASDFRSLGAVSSNARFALGATGYVGYSCWRLEGVGQELRRELIWSWPGGNKVYEAVFAPDSQSFLLMRAASEDLAMYRTLDIGIYRTIDGQRLSTLQSDSGRFQPIRFTPDGCKILTARSTRILSWDVKKGCQHQTIVVSPTKKQFRDVAIHPGGAILAGLSSDDVVSLFDIKSGGLLRSYDWKIGKLQCVAFTPDGTGCAVGNSRGKVLLFDVE